MECKLFIIIQDILFNTVIIQFRISGNAASNKNIHGTVSEQLKKNFAKSRWKVSSYNIFN